MIRGEGRMKQSTVLFLCTGNYYRSRFAEMLFNALAEQRGLSWLASSRALALERGYLNVGPISAAARQRLLELGVAIPPALRMPRQVADSELAEAALIVALKEAEHRPLLEERYPAWTERVEFWHIHDVEAGSVEEALDGIERQVRALVARLHPHPNGHR